MTRERRPYLLGAMVLLSLLLHVAVVEFTPRRAFNRPAAHRAPSAARPVPIQTRKEQVRLPGEQQKAEEAVRRELPQKVEPPKVVHERPPREPSPVTPPKPAAAPKPAEAPKPATPASKPAPLILTNVAMNGGVQVQTGATSNLFGDPTVDATGWKQSPTGPRTGDASQPGGGAEAAAHRVVVKPPEAMNQVKGKYPEAHRDLNRVVRVELMLAVDAEGGIGKVVVVKGDLPAFDEEARRTVLALKFKPATRDGTAIPYQLKWTVVFLPEGG